MEEELLQPQPNQQANEESESSKYQRKANITQAIHQTLLKEYFSLKATPLDPYIIESIHSISENLAELVVYSPNKLSNWLSISDTADKVYNIISQGK